MFHLPEQSERAGFQLLTGIYEQKWRVWQEQLVYHNLVSNWVIYMSLIDGYGALTFDIIFGQGWNLSST